MARKPSYALHTITYSLDKVTELHLKNYIQFRKDREVAGGLVGDIKGSTKGGLVFTIKTFLPFPNFAEDKRNFGEIPSAWFEILDEWRLFVNQKLKFVGFLHSHPDNSSRISLQDTQFAISLNQKYGTIIFIIIGENSSLRCYLFKNETPILIDGTCSYYKKILR